MHPPEPVERWGRRAAEAHGVLLARYRNRVPLSGWPGLFRMRSPVGIVDRYRHHYWWQAHTLDALIDAQARAPTIAGLRHIDSLVRGIRLITRGRWVNEYYDDMAWMGLAMLRAHHVGARTIAPARRLCAEIISAWNPDQGGGIPWRRSQPYYRNVPANGPAAILAARLGALGDAAPARWAPRILDWMETTLVDPSSGLAWDGVNQRGDGTIEKRLLTYNQGVLIGAQLEVRSGESGNERRERALRTAGATIEAMAPDGLLPDEGGGDGGLFKGILVRYLAQLDDPAVGEFLLANGEAAWAARDGAGRFGTSWSRAPVGGADLSTHLSGLMLMERLAAAAPSS